jgi:phospholipid transport system substrate-binding protein
MSKAVLSILVFLFFMGQSLANEAKEVESFVNDLGNKIIAVASDNKLKVQQRRDRLTEVIDGVVDTNWIAKFVLGKHYRVATDAQKEQFKKLYHEFMVNTYGPKFNGYNGEKFSITNVSNDNNYYTAKCIFYPKNNEPNINLDFRVRKNSSGTQPKFLIFDVVAEGVSLIETQRSEFGTVIAKDGLDKFMVDLQERIKKLKDDKTQPSKVKTSVKKS